MLTTYGADLAARRVVTTFLSVRGPLPLTPMAFLFFFNPVNSFGIFRLQVLVNVVQKRVLVLVD